jgi:hypothetical protein
MNLQPATLLTASLAGSAVGALAGLLFLRRERAANSFAFGCASLAALCGVIFGQNCATCGGVDSVIPVDVYIPGCPPNPHALLHGILKAIGRLKT